MGGNARPFVFPWVAVAAWAADPSSPTLTDLPTSQPTSTQAATFTLQDAQDLFLEGYYDRAVEQFEALAADPAHKLAATLGIVRCRWMTGDYDEARQRVEAVENVGVSSADWQGLAGEVDAVVGRYESAIEHARQAIKLHKTHWRARRLLGELLETVGRREEAVEVYRWFEERLNQDFPPTAEAVTETAKGFHRYNILTTHPNLNERTSYVLNELLQVAYTRLDRTYWPARVTAADLLRSKFNLEEAAEDYKAALRINNNLPEAYVGLGRIALERWDFEETERRVAAALAINARYLPAWALRVEQKITERRYAEAAETCRQALEMNPNDLRMLSLAAAAALSMDDPARAQGFQTRVERINPRPALMHAILGDVLAARRQFAASEQHYLKAIDFDPTDANTRCELGMMCMQWGYEDKARTVLEAAWALDQFNARTKDTLELLESLEAFATQETEHFLLRYDGVHDTVLPRVLADFLEDIYEEVCADYAAHPPVKTIIEVFPSARAFGVRITGKPWIFTVGACTGRVIALTSPRHDPQTLGPYNCARVLRHELAHTVTLAATHNRIPHWFTEGLAVLQEDAPRSFAWCARLADRVRRDELFTLESIDWGFMRPRRPDDRQVAYAQSEWMCEYLIERFGYGILNRMLADYREGLTQEQVFLKETGAATAQFDTDFHAWARRQAEAWGFPLDPPENVIALRALAWVQADAGVLGRLARAELDDDNPDKALEAARKALANDEHEKNALEVFVKVLGRYAEEKRDDALRPLEDEMLPALKRLLEIEPSNGTALKLRARIALRREEFDEAADYLGRLQRHCPLDPFSYSGLAGIYLDREEPDLALPQLLELARTDEHDPEVPGQIAAIYAQRGRTAEARHWYRQALYIDPFQPAVHTELAGVLMRLGDTKGALAEYLVLCELQPQSAGPFAQAALAFQKLGDTPRAKDYARKAVALDPASPAKALLE